MGWQEIRLFLYYWRLSSTKPASYFFLFFFSKSDFARFSPWYNLDKTNARDTQLLFFVRDGIHSVADYNSTLMGVVLVVVLVVVVVVVRFFTMG